MAVGTIAMAGRASAAIAVVDTLAGAPVNSGTGTPAGTNINQPFTVTGGNVLVVELATRNGSSTSGTNPGTPALTYNGQALTQAASQGSTSGNPNFRNVAIYYLFDPAPASSSIAGTLSAGTDATNVNYAITAFTLSGVNTAVAPQTASQDSGTTTNVLNITGITAGSAAVFALDNAIPANSLNVASSSGTTTQFTSSNTNATAVDEGYITGLAAGTGTFTASGNTGSKFPFAAAVFQPVPEPASAALFAVAAGGLLLRRRRPV